MLEMLEENQKKNRRITIDDSDGGLELGDETEINNRETGNFEPTQSLPDIDDNGEVGADTINTGGSNSMDEKKVLIPVKQELIFSPL